MPDHASPVEKDRTAGVEEHLQHREALLQRIVASDDGRVRTRRRIRIAPILVVVALLQCALIVYLLSAGRSSTAAQDASETVAADVAGQNTVSQAGAAAAQLVAQGYVVAQRQATVSSRLLGVIEDIYVDEGDVVAKGQVLGQLDPRDAELGLRALRAELNVLKATTQSARAELSKQQSYLARNAELHERGYLSQIDRDLVQTNFDIAKAALASALSREENAREQIARAQLQKDDLSIRAPFAGVVIERNAQPGEVLAPSGAGGGFTRTGLCTIVDMRSLQIVIDVNEQMITRVEKDQKVEAELSAYRDLKVVGRVAQITPSADRGRGTVRVRIQLLTEDPRILPDMAVKVRFL